MIYWEKKQVASIVITHIRQKQKMDEVRVGFTGFLFQLLLKESFIKYFSISDYK